MRIWSLVLIWMVATSPVGAGPAAQTPGVNLLVNPSFEGNYSIWNGIPEVKMPHGWQPWWSEYPHNADWQNLRPEFDRAATYDGYGYRVHGGTLALRYFKSFGSFTAGVYQVVDGITPGANLEFSAWGHAWSCSNWDLCHEEQADGTNRVWSEPANANVVLKIGIDPTGGTDPFSDRVVWSAGVRALDYYRQFTVRATAQAARVTVFTFAWQEWAANNQDAYWDDASLVVVGGGQAVPPTTAPLPTSAPVPAADLDARQAVYTVQRGDTLSEIAYRHYMTLADLRALNGIAPGDNMITAGQQLVVNMPEATRTMSTATPEPVEATDPAPSAEPETTTEPPPALNPRDLLAFASDWDGDWELFIADIAGNQVYQITENDADDLDPVWSPDGTRLAFASDREGDWNIYVMDLACLDTGDGCGAGDATQITEDPADDRHPAWASEGNRLVFQSNREGNWQIYLIDIASGLVQLLITSSADNIAPVWQPNPSLP